jgi:hypothetical protein
MVGNCMVVIIAIVIAIVIAVSTSNEGMLGVYRFLRTGQGKTIIRFHGQNTCYAIDANHTIRKQTNKQTNMQKK